jgi:hypothetical protein
VDVAPRQDVALSGMGCRGEHSGAMLRGLVGEVCVLRAVRGLD